MLKSLLKAIAHTLATTYEMIAERTNAPKIMQHFWHSGHKARAVLYSSMAPHTVATMALIIKASLDVETLAPNKGTQG